MHKLIAVLLLSFTMLRAEDLPGASAPPIAARYEIARTAVGVLRLDRYTGKVTVLNNYRGNEHRWTETQGPETPSAPSEPRFQLNYLTNMTNGSSIISSVILIDTLTGKTWVYDRFAQDRIHWKPIEETPPAR